MEIKKFTFTRIDLATQGWSIEQTAAFYGITSEELMAVIEKGKYIEGELINGQLRWDPEMLRMFKWMNDVGFVPRAIGASFGGEAKVEPKVKRHFKKRKAA